MLIGGQPSGDPPTFTQNIGSRKHETSAVSIRRKASAVRLAIGTNFHLTRIGGTRPGRSRSRFRFCRTVNRENRGETWQQRDSTVGFDRPAQRPNARSDARLWWRREAVGSTFRVFLSCVASAALLQFVPCGGIWVAAAWPGIILIVGMSEARDASGVLAAGEVFLGASVYYAPLSWILSLFSRGSLIAPLGLGD